MTAHSLPKSPRYKSYLAPVAGEQSMVTLNGPSWKTMRALFNPGFSKTHLMTLIPLILDETTTFIDILRGNAATGKLFSIENAATRLTIDIITKVVL